MNTDVLVRRATMLMEQHRPEQAAEQLRMALASDPNHAVAHALLALCLLEDRDQWLQATREAEQAIGLEPDSGFAHYVLANVLSKRNRHDEALSAINTALSIDSEDADYYGLQASLYARQDRWRQALESAEQGLSFDAENSSCESIRSLALERLGRVEDALSQAQESVSRRPDSADARVALAWAMLNRGDHQSAAIEFREALRLEPSHEMARIGMIQALNSRYLIFRWIFSFYQFVGRMAQYSQWAVILGMFVGMRLLRAAAQAYPAIQPFVLPISVLYIGFCLLSWIATPLFNTFLRFHPFGRYLLSGRERWASNCIAAVLGVALLVTCAELIQGNLGTAFLCGVLLTYTTMPIASAFSIPEGWPMYVAAACAVALTSLGFSVVAMLLFGGPWATLLVFYALGIFGYSFIGNALSNVTVRH